jgi:hypothetical protein
LRRGVRTGTDSVESELFSLRSRLGEAEVLDDELRDVRGDIRSVEDDPGGLRSDLAELDDGVRGHIQDTEQVLKRLTGRVQVLEARLLAAEGAPHAGLDTIDPEWKTLARTTSHGWRVRSGLLSAHRREAHHRTIRECEGALEERDEYADGSFAAVHG